MTIRGLTKFEMAAQVASDISEGMTVNLGIGLPTLVSRHIPAGREVILHSENGILGMGPEAKPGHEDPDLINAGKQPVTLLRGAAIFDHVLSFTLMRGGHVDLSILGAYQVSAKGDIANWSTGVPSEIPAVGGAMDLVAGARSIYVMMQHVTKDNAPRIVKTCTLPLTGIGVVSRIYTNLATIDVTPSGLVVRAMVKALSFEQLQNLTEATLTLARQVTVLEPSAVVDSNN